MKKLSFLLLLTMAFSAVALNAQQVKKVDKPVKINSKQVKKLQKAMQQFKNPRGQIKNLVKTWPNDPIGVKMFKLPNGLTVLLSENHETPRVFGMVVVKAGGKNDPADATGLAHYLEHMLFKGTQTMGTVDYKQEKPYLDKINDLYEELGKTSDPEERKAIQKQINEQSVQAGQYAIPNEIDKILGAMGSTGVNAFTTEDFTAFINAFPSNQIQRWLEVYSHRFEKPVFRLFQSELETVYEEKNRSNDNPFMKVYETFLKSFWKHHPYGQQPLIGTTEHLKNPPLKKMYAYFDKYYVANNMALILSGDFRIREIMPLIQEKFGDWRTGEIDAYPEYKEDDFTSRELVEVKYTPIKAEIMGFRMPSLTDDDSYMVDLVGELLSNSAEAGLIDQLMVNDKLMGASVMPVQYNDQGGLGVIVIPKILGQKLDDAEQLVVDQIHQLKSGSFDASLLEAAKTNLMNQYEENWETNQDRVMTLMEAFTSNQDWGAYLQKQEKVKSVTKEDVIAFANKYLGDGYLALQSKMGFPKKDKLEKPAFEPVIPKNEVNSVFREKLQQIPEGVMKPHFVDFDKDFVRGNVQAGIHFIQYRNPVNDLFDMRIRFGTGYHSNRYMRYLPQYLDIVGADTLDAIAIKQAFYKIGCNYYFDVDEYGFYVYLDGPESNLDQALQLVNALLQHPQDDPKKVKKIISDLKAENKMNRREPDFIAGALNEYALYGDQSDFLTDLNNKELSKMTTAQLIGALKNAVNYEADIWYTGRMLRGAVAGSLQKNMLFAKQPVPKEKEMLRKRIVPDQTTVYFVPKKSAVQSQIYFSIEGTAYNSEQQPVVDAFNKYFGGDMSSLVFQEIREFRSLAYSAYGIYRHPDIKGYNNKFMAYIGTQGDKSPDAIQAMMNLIDSMPAKPSRMGGIRSSLVQKAQSERPGFRDMISYVEDMKKLGYDSNPQAAKIDRYQQIKYSDINDFYRKNIKGKPRVLTIVGDPRKFDVKGFEKYGSVITVKEKKLFVN